jgi:hypothetical protein
VIDGIELVVRIMAEEDRSDPLSEMALLGQSMSKGMPIRTGDLVRVDVDPCDICARVGRDAGGDATSAAADIQSATSVLKVKLTAHLLLEQSLILP